MSWAESLEARGFKRSIAGEQDFAAAVHALEQMRANHDAYNEAVKRGDLFRPRRKGIIVSGEYGVGKTCYMDAVSDMFVYRPYRIDLSQPDEVGKLDPKWMAYNACDLFRQHVYLDDLGAELGGNDYGVRFELVTQFISAYFVRSKGALFITTNLRTAEVDKRYNGRILSRLKDLCIPIRFYGKDKRRWEI